MKTLDLWGRKVSIIALGTMDFGGKIAEGRAREYLDAYVALGGNLIDTARIYGDFEREIQGGSEEVIGRWLQDRHCRGDIVLGTKGGHPDVRTMHTGRLSRGELRDDIRRSLDALRTDAVDMYWLHRDDISRPVEDILETLTGLVEDGYTRHVGVSNWSPERIAEALQCAQVKGLVKIDGNQPQFSLARQINVEDDTLCQMDAATWQLHEREQLPCLCFSSQAKGFLAKLDAQGDASLSNKSRRRYLCPENLDILRRIQALAKTTGHSVAALSLAWLTAQPFPCIPIAGVSRMEHFETIAEAGELTLTSEQRDGLRSI